MGWCILTWLSGCNPVKQVLKDPAKKEIVGREWEKENPCIPTAGTITPGKEIIDTVYSNDILIDTLYKTDSLETVATGIIIKKMPVYITKVRVDTITKPDIRREGELNKDISFRDGKIVQLQADNAAEKKSKSNWMWIAIGLFSLHVLFLYLKFRKGFSIIK